jgi:hypothetical protein
MSRFYEVGPVGEVAINLFHGYGYNFYRIEAQLRADDQRVRALACDLLNKARTALDNAEADYRRRNLPAPTRANPFPPASAVADAQQLERMAKAVGAIEGQLRNQPVPENDRMTQRFREEAPTLEALIDADAALVSQCEQLRALLAGASGEAILEQRATIEQNLAAIEDGLRRRQSILA